MEDGQPGDRLCLRSCGSGSCSSHTLWTEPSAVFGFLPPGGYVLTLNRIARRLCLVLELPPGGNVILRCHLAEGWCRWRRDPCRSFLNAT
ncbi:hypothetical protein H7U37_05930 [Pseudoflavonifractor phocaeensis]|uniref:hypothetical protein n=1 Tax=Pseudoflavonifractor phocaeensis TaxID=1870988 RepID=UPI00195A3DBD|nr:hypothetical protein [Pseudoflavonifractor phocaeensis]MBM6938073.1 hypothetical protein [Pseudoflavonifractor phocaeensis]